MIHTLYVFVYNNSGPDINNKKPFEVCALRSASYIIRMDQGVHKYYIVAGNLLYLHDHMRYFTKSGKIFLLKLKVPPFGKICTYVGKIIHYMVGLRRLCQHNFGHNR